MSTRIVINRSIITHQPQRIENLLVPFWFPALADKDQPEAYVHCFEQRGRESDSRGPSFFLEPTWLAEIA